MINHRSRTALKTARYLSSHSCHSDSIAESFHRALRWRLLINSLGYNSSTSNTFFAVMIGYLTNLALPRLGEVLRCTVLARYEKIPAEKLIGTVILERLIDAITLALRVWYHFCHSAGFLFPTDRCIFSFSKSRRSKTDSFLYHCTHRYWHRRVYSRLWMVIKKKKFQ